MRPTIFNFCYHFFGFFKRKLNKEINRLYKSNINSLKKEFKSIDSKHSGINLNKNIFSNSIYSEKFLNSSSFIKYQNVLDSINDLNFLSAKKLLEEISYNSITEMNELDKAFFNLIRSKVLLENGYYKEALNSNTKASDILEKNFNKFDPIIIYTNLDKIEANISTTNNFQNLKEKLIEELAKASLIKDYYLVTKAYILLSIIHNLSFNDGNCKYTHKQALKTYKNNNLNNNYLLYKLVNLNYYSLKETGNYLKKLSKKTDIHPRIKFIQKKNELILNDSNLYKSLEETDDLINKLIENNFNDILLVHAYYNRFIIMEKMNRDQTSDYYMDLANQILNKNYNPDSFIYLEYYIYFLYQSIEKNIKKYKYDMMMNLAYKNINIKNLLYPNSFTLFLYYCNLINSTIIKQSVPDVNKKYQDFYTIHKNLIGSSSNGLVSLNFLLRINRYKIYDSYIE